MPAQPDMRNGFETDFINLSPEAKKIVLGYNPEFAKLSPEAQDIVVTKYTEQFKPPTTPTSYDDRAKQYGEIKTETWKDRLKSDLLQGYRNVVRPAVEMAGMVGGAMVGGTSGTFGAGPLGTAGGGIVGAGLGTAGTSKVMDVLEEAVKLKRPSTFKQAITSTGKDFISGVEGELAGPIINKAVGGVTKGVSRLGQEILGSTTGSGRGAIQGSIAGGKAFTDAMRGKTSGEEIANNAREAVQVIRDKRAFNYQTKLKEIDAITDPIDPQPIFNKTAQLMKNFNVRITPKGEIDVSRVKMGETGKRDIEKIIKRVQDHGNQAGDNTASGLDGLKRELDDFYSDSSQARAFVESLRTEVKKTIVKTVPQYAEMTKGYAEATSLIKDIESGLMLKKSGMSGRVTADNTLRRLTSAMRENFEMRKDLLEVLGNESGKDIVGQVSGYAMNQALPHGLMGKIGGGGLAYMAYLNPKMWPLMAAASPRVVGEFLNTYGRAKRFTKPATDVVVETAKRITAPATMYGLKNDDSRRSVYDYKTGGQQ